MTLTVASPNPFSTAALEGALKGIESAEATTRVPHHAGLHVYTNGVVVEVGAKQDLDAWAAWCRKPTLAGSCCADRNGHLLQVHELTTNWGGVPVTFVYSVLVRCPQCWADQ